MSIPRNFLLMAVTPLLLLLATSTLNAQAQKAETSAELVNLPAYEVNERPFLPPPESWNYAQIPGFEVISNGVDLDTRRLLRDFEMFRMALGIAWPTKFKAPPPSALILCARNNTFNAFVPTADGSISKDVNRQRMGVTLISPERAFIVLDLQSKILTLNPSVADYAGGAAGAVDMNIDRNGMLFREYVRYLMARSQGPMPIWYEEGLLQVTSKMEIYPRLITLGRLDSVSASEPLTEEQKTDGGAEVMPIVPIKHDVDFHIALKSSPLLSFEDFFGVSADSGITQNPFGIWAKQSYAFVHMCLFQMGKPYKTALETFVTRAGKEPVTETLFAECFGKSYKEFLIELRGYVDLTDYQYEEFNITGKNTLEYEPPEMREATEGEWTRIKGDALHLAGRAGLARDALVAAYIRGERDPEFLGTLGLSELSAGNLDRAEKFLTAATAGKCRRPSAYIALGRLRLEQAIAKPKGVDGQISAGQLKSVLEALFAARRLAPAQAETYELIATAWSRCEVTPKQAGFIALSEGLRFFPRNQELIYKTASLNIRARFYEAARALVEYGIQKSPTDTERARYAELQKNLPAPIWPTAP